MSRYPKILVHPNYRKGTAKPVDTYDANGKKVIDYQGTPDVFPSVTVHIGDQEELYRAKGYYDPAEGEPSKMSYQDFPVWLSHPDGLPAVLANDATQEETHVSNGYVRPGKGDPEAVQAALASPYDPNRVTSEWPKMVDGVLVDPTKADDFLKYPMWVGDKLVHNEAQERAARGLPEDEPSTPDRDLMLLEADERGIKIDKRWSDAKIRAALDAEEAA
jgi:hypothetical protein